LKSLKCSLLWAASLYEIKSDFRGDAQMNEPRKPSPRKSPSEQKLDEGLEATFPASDPPAHTTPTSIGGPARSKRPTPEKPGGRS
jgi:hypothetical protein